MECREEILKRIGDDEMIEALIGKWKYALNKKLKKRLREVALLKLCLKIDKLGRRQYAICGTVHESADCPFLFYDEEHPLCLAPRFAPEWYEAQKGYVSPLSIEKMVIGCYILPFCRRGYENYQRLRIWFRRSKKNFGKES